MGDKESDPSFLLIDLMSGMKAQERTAGAPVSRRVARKTQKRHIQHQIAHGTGSEYWPRLFPPDLLKHLLIFHDSHNCPENCVSFWTGKIEQTAIFSADIRSAVVETIFLTRTNATVATCPCLGAIFFEYPGQASVGFPSVLDAFMYLPRVNHM